MVTHGGRGWADGVCRWTVGDRWQSMGNQLSSGGGHHWVVGNSGGRWVAVADWWWVTVSGRQVAIVSGRWVEIEISSFEIQKISLENTWIFKIISYYYPNKEFQVKVIEILSKNTLSYKNAPSKRTLKLPLVGKK